MQDHRELDGNFRKTYLVHLILMIVPMIASPMIAVIANRSAFSFLDQHVHVPVLGTLAVVAVVLLFIREQTSAARALRVLTATRSVPKALAAAQLMRSAINEAVALLGLLAFLLTGNMGMSLVFVGVGFFALVRTRPLKHEWRSATTKGLHING